MSFDTYELSDRKRSILRSIVEAHIKLGEPVGSKYLMQEAKIPYSSATIRNEMAELEALGWSCYDGLHDGNVEDGRWFDAEVLDVHEGSISVRGFEGTLEGFYEEITVSCRLKSGETVTGFSEGDVIRITYSGEMAESYPPQIFGVYSIENLSRID